MSIFNSRREAKAAPKAQSPSKPNKWGQAKGGWSPFAQSPPETVWKICPTCDGAGAYDAWVRGKWITYSCKEC